MPDTETDDDRWLRAEIAATSSADGTSRPTRPVITAATMRDLLLRAVRPAGITVSHVDIDGDLDLSYARIDAPIRLLHCVLDRPLRLAHAELLHLDLTGSAFAAGIAARLLKVTGDLTASHCTVTDLHLEAATIGGDLSLDGATLTNPDGDALNADGATITGDLTADEITAIGRIQLIDATIGGQFSLNRATLTNPDGNALNADGATITGGLFADDGFKATRQVQLIGATIGGDLSLQGATLTDPDGYALSADRATITGGLFADDGFKATGQVRLPGATIGGQLSLYGATLTNPNGDALNADGVGVAELLVHNETIGDTSTSRISFVGAQIGRLTDSPNGWRRLGRVDLLDARYDTIRTGGWTIRQRLAWLDSHGTFQAQPFEQLARVLRSQGRTADARTVTIAKLRRERRQEPRLRRVGGWVFDRLLGYGFHPWRVTVPLLAAVYAIGAFWLIPAALDAGAVVATRTPARTSNSSAAATSASNGTATPTPTTTAAGPLRAIPGDCPADYPCFSRFAYTVDVLVPLVNTRQTDYWAVAADTPAGQHAVWFTRIATPLGWTLSTAAALGYTTLIRRRD